MPFDGLLETGHAPTPRASDKDGNELSKVHVEQILIHEDIRNIKSYLYSQNLAGKILYLIPTPAPSELALRLHQHV
jgi:hypothetical protein